MAFPGKQIRNEAVGMSLRFVQTARDTDGALLQMEATYKPHSLEPPPHFHPAQDELFTVVSGSICVRINGVLRSLQAGDRLEVPRGAVHSMWNESAGTTVLDWQVRPALQTEQFLETVHGLAAAGRVSAKGTPSLLQGVQIASHFHREFRLAQPPAAVQRIVFALLRPLARIAGYRPVYQEYLD